MKKNIPFGRPIVNNLEQESLKKVLISGKYVHGKKTLEFEKLFKKYTNSKYAVSLSSCTAGLHLFYFALGILKGDEVIVPAQTHVATVHAIELVGAKPIFIDCELETGNIDLNLGLNSIKWVNPSFILSDCDDLDNQNCNNNLDNKAIIKNDYYINIKYYLKNE